MFEKYDKMTVDIFKKYTVLIISCIIFIVAILFSLVVGTKGINPDMCENNRISFDRIYKDMGESLW